MFYELFLAARYLKPRRNAVSLITLTSILGVTLGVMVLMVVMAVMSGFTEEMKNKLIETQSHFQIRNPRGVLSARDVATVDRILQKHNSSGTPVIQSPVLVQYGTTNAFGQTSQHLDTRSVIFAASEDELIKHLNLDKYIKAGSLKLGSCFEDDANYAVISTYMADRWNLQPGDRFLVHSAKHLTDLVKFNAAGGIELNDESTAYLPAEFTVAGIYALGKSDFDQLVFFTGLDDAAELFFESGQYAAATSVYGWGPDAFNQQKLLQDLSDAMPEFAVIGWEEANRSFLEVLAVEKLMMFFLLIFIVLVAAFSITNTLITSIYQKTREIGLLKALGCTDASIMRIFILQGFLVGLTGSISGSVLGYLVIRFRQNILDFASMVSGQELFPKKFYFFDQLPAQIIPSDVAFIVISSIVLCTLGALLPALRAARLHPSEALRYE
ncbi:MAG: ABC transporter permease [Lentisphaerae bacterium]|nr:ABC transporter permease [Lentisphaerota bacterium]